VARADVPSHSAPFCRSGNRFPSRISSVGSGCMPNGGRGSGPVVVPPACPSGVEDRLSRRGRKQWASLYVPNCGAAKGARVITIGARASEQRRFLEREGRRCPRSTRRRMIGVSGIVELGLVYFICTVVCQCELVCFCFFVWGVSPI